MKIRYKLLLGYVSIALLVAVLGTITIQMSRQELQDSIGDKSELLAEHIIGHIDEHIFAQIVQIQMKAKAKNILIMTQDSNRQFSELENIQAYIEEKDREWTSSSKETLTTFQRQIIDSNDSESLRENYEMKEFFIEKYGYAVYGEIFVTNKYGANVAQTQITSDFYQADEEWWTTTKAEGLFVSDVQYDESANMYSLDICRRIENTSGEFIGILKVVFNLKDIVTMIDQEKGGSGYSTTQIKLLTKSGMVIYDTEGTGPMMGVQSEQFREIQEEDERYFIVNRKNEEERLVAMAHAEEMVDFAGTGWIILVENDTDELFASINVLRNILIVATTMISLFAISLGFILARHIYKPIDKLGKAIAKIGKGDYDVRVTNTSKDEIGQVGITLNNMTEALKDAKQKEETQLTEIKNINSKLNDYSFTISHDLKEPIRSINTFSQFIKEDYADKFDDEGLDYLSRIIKASKRMAAMIDDLLQLSRVGRTDVEFSNADIGEILKRVEAELIVIIEESHTTIIAEQLPVTICQPVWIQAVLRNLISNSIKYGNPEKTEINIKYSETYTHYEFFVTDNGQGIPGDQHEKIFGLFRRATQDKNSEGSGAGLAIVSAVIEEHKGSVCVEHSEVGVGTTIKFTIAKNLSNVKRRRKDDE